MVNATPSDIGASIRKKLAVTMNGLSMEVGSPEGKIIDAFAETIFEATADSLIIGTNFDIDTKSGVDLDALVGIFGFGRQQGRKARGELRFSLAAPATQAITIPVGTQAFVYSMIVGQSATSFVTTQVGIIDAGQTEVYVPAEAAVPGVQGNASSNTITGINAGAGITSVINPLPFYGGTDMESDDQLRYRFKTTFLRNIAGTEDFYRALCLSIESVSRVNVLGPIERYYEQLQMGTNTTPITSQITNAKYIWPKSDFLISDPETINERYYTPAVDYNLDISTNPPKLVPISPDLQTGGVVDLEYEYSSIFSRNDPVNNITNKVDVFHNGMKAINVAESTVIKSQTLNTTAGSPLNVANFLRWDTGVAPATGSKFQRLGSTPVVIPPGKIVVGATTYNIGTDYTFIYDVTNMRGSEREMSGILWLTATPPADGQKVTIEYSYNRVSELLNSILKAKKQITTDILVHEAKYRRCKVNAHVMYNQGAPIDSVNATIQLELSKFFGGLNFGDWVQFSDIEQTIHNVTGVDNCRITRSTDNATNYGIEKISNTGASIVKYDKDFKLDDDELAQFTTINIVRKSYNTFTV